MARLKVKYTEEVAPALFKKFGYKSTMQIPKIEKVVLNVGCGEAREKPKGLAGLGAAGVTGGSYKQPTLPAKRIVEVVEVATRITKRKRRGGGIAEEEDIRDGENEEAEVVRV